MRGETEKDRPATPERKELIEELMVAGRALSTATVMFHSVLAENVGLTSTEDKAMELLDRLGPLTPGKLAEYSGLARASVTALVDRLERKGFVRRVRRSDDRRSVLVEVNPERARSIDALLTSWVGELTSLFDEYDDGELRVILGFLEQAAKRQQEMTVELAAGSTEA
ncbi:MarR family transcriptional regulator [Amycolatopsis ultiminotia]|uniref:MarR family transcriptional regulator n=1 Tax=Amycolatopsis ultiminotia TaxID=543629 RepID=A0ABP6YP25_9PSEU